MVVTQQPPTTAAAPENPPSLRPIEARLRLAAIVESSDDAIISKNLQGIITTWNSGATRLFGYTADEIIGKSVLTLIPPDLQSEEPEILRKLTAGERIEHYETRRRRKNGELVHISLTISPIRDITGRIVGISKIARDITERKQTEAALFESERIAAMGRMAASIAHEVNNPLEAILNISYLLSQHPSLDEEARAYTHLLLNEVTRISEITRQTLSFYRESTDIVPVDVAALAEEMVRLHRPLAEQKSIRILTKFEPSSFICARPGEIRQVITNLLINAIDALPRGGQIKIGVSRVSGARAVAISVADNGTGIPEDVRTRIFDPFFSTKKPKGTGLGLWVTQGIVRKCGGSIRLRTSTDPAHRTGTIFRVTLPVES